MLGDQPWDALTPADYRRCADGFSLLTPIGLFAYLPGYMRAEVVPPRVADVISDQWRWTFNRDTTGLPEQLDALTPLFTAEQAEAMYLFLLLDIRRSGLSEQEVAGICRFLDELPQPRDGRPQG